MPSRFVEVWLQGNSYLPVPRAFVGEPYRLYVNRVRGFFAKHAPDYPALDADLLQRAFVESRYLDKNSKQLVSQAAMSSRIKPWGSTNAGKYRAQMAARQAAIQRRQAQMGWRVTSFAPTSRSSALVPETKYFDTAIDTTVTWNGATWADSEVPCDFYVNSSGSSAAYTDSALIPSAVGSGYGQVNGNRYKLKKIRVRGSISKASASDQADAGNSVDFRLMLIMDTQPNGSQAQGEDVMADFGAAASNLYSFKNTSSSSGRFRILKDKFMTLDVTNSQLDNALSTGTPQGSSYTGSWAYNTKFFSFQYSPRSPIQVNIKSGNATPTVAGLESCNIFLLLAGTAAGAAQAVVIRGASRAYYVD